jgi:hypothetical protein
LSTHFAGLFLGGAVCLGGGFPFKDESVLALTGFVDMAVFVVTLLAPAVLLLDKVKEGLGV